MYIIKTSSKITSVIEGATSQASTPIPTVPVVVNNIKICNEALNEYELCSIGATKDSYSPLTGIITHNIGVKVFTGTEAWAKHSTYDVFTLTDNTINVSDIENDICFCNYLQGIAPKIGVGSVGSGQIKAGYKQSDAAALTKTWYVGNFGLENVAAFKAWLAEKYAAGAPVKVYYLKTTPTITEIGPAYHSAPKFYGDIKVPKAYVKALSSDPTNYPDTLENYGILTDISTGTWSKASGGYFYRETSPSGAYSVYCKNFSSKSSTSVPRVTHNSGRLYLYNVTYADVTELKAAIAGIDVLLKATDEGYTWIFAKRVSDSKFGYYCAALDIFFEVYSDVTGTVTGDIYNHFMLKGGND